MIATSTRALINKFKARLKDHVEIMDLGELHWLLSIKILRDRQAWLVHLSQRSYIDAILRRFGFEDLKPMSILMDTQKSLSAAQSPMSTSEFAAMRNVPYREAVGSLMYLALATRPDIAFAVSVVSHFAIRLGLEHWESIKRIFRYLKGTWELWLTYGSLPGGEKLQGYADVDGSMAEDQHTILGYAFMLGGGTVSWSSK